MIIVSINGGLGNQLFQYAFGKHLAHLYREEVYFDLSVFDNPQHRPFALDHFNVTINKATQSKLPFHLRKGFKQLKFIRSLLNRFFYPYQIVEQQQFDFNSIYLEKRNAYYWGYWQSEKYFDKIKDAIKQEFTFKDDFSNVDKEISEKIKKQNAVCVHVRRGDYIGHSLHPICDISYYERAIDTVVNKTEYPFFFIFSDDISWCKKNLSVDFPHAFVSTGIAWRDLRLMTLCNHYIIANSSFSWWGAYLGTHDEKIVVSPKLWFIDSEKYNTKDLRPKKWITL